MGNVGAEVVRIITENADDLRERIGASLVIRGIAVRDASRDRGVPRELLTTDPGALVRRDDVDIIIEVLGGIETAARAHPYRARTGQPVVTANKALLAEYTGESRQGGGGGQRRPV